MTIKVSTIPDFNIDTRKTLDFFVALFGLNLNEHESTIKNASWCSHKMFKWQHRHKNRLRPKS